MKSKSQDAGRRSRGAGSGPAPEPERAGLEAAARVIALGGRVPKRFSLAVASGARPSSAGPTLDAATARAKVTPARLAAFEILSLVSAGKAHSDELLHGGRTQALSEADRHLATALVMGVLRWQIALDARVRTLLERPDQALPAPVLLALRLGAFQLLYMDRIPAHAALSESVELCRAAGHPHATGMVNAILRKLAASPAVGDRLYESTAAFAERLGHPLWLVERWVSHFGREVAQKICGAGQVEPESEGLFAADSALPRIDDGSRLVAELAAAAMPEVQGRPPRVWDCCAAPGGKTLVLAKRLAELHPGSEILATDVSRRRLAQMQARFRQFSYASEIQTKVAEAASLAPEEGLFDLILCDVPCSGTGTLARNPEIRARLKREDLLRQADRQRSILEAALLRLAPGGRLVYSTCSLEPEENEEIGAGMARLPVGEILREVPGLRVPAELLLREGTLRTLPGVHPCDGFYAVIFAA